MENKVLEFNKILELLKEKALLDDTKVLVDNLKAYKSLKEINAAYQLVYEATICIQKYGELNFYFHESLKYKMEFIKKGGVFSETDLNLYNLFFRSIFESQNLISQFKQDELRNIKEAINKLNESFNFANELSKILDEDGLISKTATPELAKVNKNIESQKHTLNKILDNALNSEKEYLTEAILVVKNDRYTLPVKKEYKNKVKGILQSESISGETLFIEPLAAANKNKEIDELFVLRERLILKILIDISETFRLEIEKFNDIYGKLINLDLIFAKAKMYFIYHGRVPKVNDFGFFNLINAFHPLLNVENKVKNTFTFSGDNKGLIITGPNTGGKTIFLKMIGLFAVMIKYGLLLSCDEGSEIPYFPKVFADIGDEQSIEQNLSTFSAHLKKIIEITKNADQTSLVVLDELGSGTDPKEGVALAISVFLFLKENCGKVFITTHFGELKNLAFQHLQIKNASMEFDLETLKPTYKLILDLPGKSNALLIAEKLGLDKKIIDNAKTHVLNENDLLKDMFTTLECEIKLQKEKTQILYENEKTLEFQKQKFEEEKSRFIKKNEENFNRQVKALEKDYETELEKLKEAFFEVNKIKDDLYALRINKIKNLLEKPRESKYLTSADEIFIGDYVFIPSLNIYGTVKEIKSKKVTVISGEMKFIFLKEDLKKANQENTHAFSSKGVTTNQITKKASLKLDLRGERVEKARDMLLDFLDDALICKLEEVVIIHGYGSGAIRKMVHEVLKNLSFIKSFRLGTEGEGLYGVTVVRIKE